MFRQALLAALWVGIVTSGADCLWANLIPISPITVDALSTTGVSFSYAGTLTQNDTLELTVTGDPCLQAGPAYCVNGAGVVTVAGTAAVGDATTFSGHLRGNHRYLRRTPHGDFRDEHSPDFSGRRSRRIRKRKSAFEPDVAFDHAFCTRLPGLRRGQPYHYLHPGGQFIHGQLWQLQFVTSARAN